MTRYSYTAQNLANTETNPLRRVADYDYTSKVQVVKITFAVGRLDEAVQMFEYDAAGNPSAIIDENDNWTEFDYDVINRQS